jgi:hypothetical protein
MADPGFPAPAAASVHVLQAGYVREAGGVQHVGSTVTLILDGDAVIVVDPGMVPDRDLLLAALAGHGPAPADVTDVVFSHHHPDHTVNAALFPAARIHDHWACYDGDVWTSRDAEGTVLSPSVRLLRTPGHSAEDHLHAGRWAGRRVRVHARLVGRGRSGRRPVRHRSRGAAGQPGAAARAGIGDHPRARPRLPAWRAAAPLAHRRWAAASPLSERRQ